MAVIFCALCVCVCLGAVYTTNKLILVITARLVKYRLEKTREFPFMYHTIVFLLKIIQ